MDGPNAAVRLDKDGNVIYGYDRGLNLHQIQKAFKFNNEVWFLVLWEGYEMLEAVPAEKINDKFPLKVIEYYEKITVPCKE